MTDATPTVSPNGLVKHCVGGDVGLIHMVESYEVEASRVVERQDPPSS